MKELQRPKRRLRARSSLTPAERAARPDGPDRVLRSDILAVATEEFGQRGYKSTNLRLVAGRLGVTRQALYHYFSRKHDILVALFTNYFDELEANLRRASAGVGPDKRFRSMLRAHLQLMAASPQISRVFEREDGEIPPKSAAIVRARRRALHALFVEAYEEGVAAGALRGGDVSLAVSTMLGVAGWLHRWYKIDGRLKPEEIAAYAEDLIYAGIRADPSRADRARAGG